MIVIYARGEFINLRSTNRTFELLITQSDQKIREADPMLRTQSFIPEVSWDLLLLTRAPFPDLFALVCAVALRTSR
jgi:hypothetical protein